LEVSLNIAAQVPASHTRACAGLTPSQCRPPLGHQPGLTPSSSRATDQSPVSMASIRFRHVPTVHSRSSSQHAPDGSRPAFSRNAHHPSRCAGAASGGLDPDPAVRARGAHPHPLCSRHILFGRVTSLSAPSRRTISCEAVPPSIWPPGAQGGTSACRTGAALSVSCIALFDGPHATVGVPSAELDQLDGTSIINDHRGPHTDRRGVRGR